MKKDTKIAYAEVCEILSLMEKKYVNKIPKDLLNMFEEEKSKEYVPKIDTSKPLDKQDLQRETLVILATLNLNYWCESEEEKEELLKEYANNDKKFEQEAREKYNPDNLFKRNAEIVEDDKKTEVQSKELVKYNENWFKKMWNKIKAFFRR